MLKIVTSRSFFINLKTFNLFCFLQLKLVKKWGYSIRFSFNIQAFNYNIKNFKILINYNIALILDLKKIFNNLLSLYFGTEFIINRI